MNKELLVKEVTKDIEELSNQEGATIKPLSRKDMTTVLEAFVNVIENTVASGEKVNIAGFGAFELSERAAREGTNPRTGEKMMIEASKSPKFKPAKQFKDCVNA